MKKEKQKKEKKVLTPEEKAEKKLVKRYSIFSHGKTATVILLILTVVCAGLLGAGMMMLGSMEGPANESMTITPREILILAMTLGGALGWIVFPFNVFRRKSMSLMAMGIVMWDVALFCWRVIGELGAVAVVCVLVGALCFWIGESARDKKMRNHKLNLREDFLIDMIERENAEELFNTMIKSADLQTTYKAKLYYTLSIMFVCMTGIGLFLPFGKRAYLYNKSIAFIVGNPQRNENPLVPYDPEICTPFGLFDKYGEFYLGGVPFASEETPEHLLYRKRAIASWRMGIFYIWNTIILRKLTFRTTFNKKNKESAGILVFSGKAIAEVDPSFEEAFVAYGKREKEDNHHDFLNALDKFEDFANRVGDRWEAQHQEYLAEKAKEEAEEAEKFEKARANATSANVVTDGNNNYYVQKTYGDNSSNVKLESYDTKTGAGTYVDESGNRIKIKNDNK